MNVFVDTNIIIDVLMQRSGFHQDALRLFNLGNMGKINLIVSALSITNTYYILSRQIPERYVRVELKKVKEYFETKPLTDKLIGFAINDMNFPDFEDGIQYYTAIENRCEFIISRNKKDFKNSQIPVLNSAEFLASLQKRN